MYKRITALILALCCVIMAVPVKAGAATGPQVTAGTATMMAGDSTALTLQAVDFSDVASLELYVYYDPEVLSVDWFYTGWLLDSAQNSVNTNEPGVVKLVTMSLDGISGSGELLSLYFSTDSDCTPGTYPVSVAIGNAYGTDLMPVSIGSQNGKVTVEKRVETESFNIYNYADRYELQKNDTVSVSVVNSWCQSFVSGDFVVEYDHELFELDSVDLDWAMKTEGAIYSVNTSVLGQIRISYASVQPIQAYDLFRVNLNVIGDADTSTEVKVRASNVYRENLSPYLPGHASQTLWLRKLPEVPDYSNAFLQTEKLTVGEESKSTFVLEAGADLAAADFTISYDPEILRCVKVEPADTLSKQGGMVVLNENYTNGTIRFSYINMEAYDEENINVVQITWEPLQSPEEHYQVSITGVGTVNAQQEAIQLEYIPDSNCIFQKSIVEAATCQKPGLVSYRCACGEESASEVLPPVDVKDCPVAHYTVRFVNADGTEISGKTYHRGDKVDVPADPTKAADNAYTYTFAGWDKAVVDCAGDATYTATYKSSYIDYTVVFKDWNGDILSTKTYHYGDQVTAPADPSKAADNTYTYAFSGWDKDVAACTGDAVYTATYKPSYIEYTVTFKNWNGEVISAKTYHYGDKVTVPADPTKAADNTYTYVFSGWDKKVVRCAGDATYTATYEPTYIEYTVEFRNSDNRLLSSGKYHWGDVVEVPAEPEKPADVDESYIFRGWDKKVTACAGDATYVAVFGPPYMLGDLDNNGSVDDEDVIYLLWHTLMADEYPVNQPVDFDHNGSVDDEDVIYLLWHTLMSDEYPL